VKVNLEGPAFDCTVSSAGNSSLELSHCTLLRVVQGISRIHTLPLESTAEDFRSHPAHKMDPDSQRADGIAYCFVTNVTREVRYIHRLPKATESNVLFLPSHPYWMDCTRIIYHRHCYRRPIRLCGRLHVRLVSTMSPQPTIEYRVRSGFNCLQLVGAIPILQTLCLCTTFDRHRIFYEHISCLTRSCMNLLKIDQGFYY